MRVLTIVSLLLAACSSASAGAPDPSPTPRWTANPGHVFQARPAPVGAEPCRDQADVARVLRDFADAFSSGDARAIGATLSAEFWALSLPHGHTYTRDDAVAFIAERQRAGERLEFRTVEVNGLVGWDGAAHIGPVVFTLLRSGDAIRLDGRGALYCGGSVRGIKVLGLGAL